MPQRSPLLIAGSCGLVWVQGCMACRISGLAGRGGEMLGEGGISALVPGNGPTLSTRSLAEALELKVQGGVR